MKPVHKVGERVLLLSKDPAIFGGGVGMGDARERHLRYARRWLEETGGRGSVKVVCWTPRSAGLAREIPGPGLELIPTRSWFRVGFVAGAWREVAKLRREGWEPDLISPQTPWEEGTLAGWLQHPGGPKILPQLHFDLFSDKWREEHWLNPWRARMAEKLMRRADGIRVVSKVLKSKLLRRLDLAPYKVHVAPVPVTLRTHPDFDDKAKYKKKLGLSGREVVLFVGRFSTEKNLDLWLNVARKIADSTDRVEFVLVGGGEDRSRMEDAVKQSPWAGRFHFTGQVHYPELPDYFAAADVFLLSSNHEGYGRVVVEAGLSGVPTVSTRCTGPEDLIDDQDTGYLLECGDGKGLADAVRVLLCDDGRRGEMGRRARAKMQREQSPEVLEERLIQSWRSVLSA
jgi:glycosyltransferase involved in cell wall biosynthesis